MNRLRFAAVCGFSALLLHGCSGLLSDRGTGAIRCTVGVADTKAQPITTDGGASNGAASTVSIRTEGFVMNAYADDDYHDNATNTDYNAGLYFSKDVTYDSGSWSIADEPLWLNGVNLRFFCWSPGSTNGTLTISKPDTDTGLSTMPFSYSAPTSCVSSTCDDIVFAYNSQAVSYDDKGAITSGNENVNLTFYHAMSQIRFCLSTDDGTYDKSLKLISVVLEDVAASGTCVFDGAETSPADMFDWSIGLSPTLKDYTQTFGTSGAEFPGTGSPETIPAGWVKTSYTDATSTTRNLYTCTGDVLFLIPQTLSSQKVEITFQKGSADPFTLEASLPDGEWEAGKYYTYKIKAAKTLSLSLLSKDWIDGSHDIMF